MNESELVRELSRRAGVPETGTRALLKALLDVVREGGVSPDILLDPGAMRLPPTAPARLPLLHRAEPRAVDELIARAKAHQLGLEFLLNGYLGAVAAEFGAHAFTVEAARDRIRQTKGEPSGS